MQVLKANLGRSRLGRYPEIVMVRLEVCYVYGVLRIAVVLWPAKHYLALMGA